MTPYFESWSAFWQMGKHGPYVWAAWGLSLLLLALLVVWARWQRHQLLRQAQRHQQRLSQRQQQRHDSQEGVD